MELLSAEPHPGPVDQPRILGNLEPGQVLYGAVAAVLLLQIWQGVTAPGPVSLGTFARIVLLLGLTLVFGVYLHNRYRYGLVPDYEVTCEMCGGPVNSFSEFCEHCGHDLVYSDLVACPSCGVEAYEGTKHCPECGASLPQPPPPDSKRAQGS